MNASSPSDDELLAAYVTGELDDPERARFELRLAAEPALAERLLAMEAVDLVGATLRATAAPQRRRVRAWPFALAAAALVAAAMWWSVPDTIPCRIAAVASLGGDDLAGYAERLGVPPERRWRDAMRSGSTTAGTATIAQFLATVADRERERAERSLTAPAPALDETFFTVRVDVARRCDAVVLRLDRSGRWERLFPSPGTPVFGEATNPLAPGLHTLPRPVVLPNAVGTLSQHAGFELAGEGAAATNWLVVALRERPVDAASLQELDDLLRTANPDGAAPAKDSAAWVGRRTRGVLGWLGKQGFTTAQCTVVAR